MFDGENATSLTPELSSHTLEIEDSAPQIMSNEEPEGTEAAEDEDDVQQLVTITNQKNSIFLQIFDHLVNLFLFTPFIVVYWASSWDIIYLYLFPNVLKISYVITFAFANAILFLSYCVQNRLQSFHDSLASTRKSYGIRA